MIIQNFYYFKISSYLDSKYFYFINHTTSILNNLKLYFKISSTSKLKNIFILSSTYNLFSISHIRPFIIRKILLLTQSNLQSPSNDVILSKMSRSSHKRTPKPTKTGQSKFDFPKKKLDQKQPINTGRIGKGSQSFRSANSRYLCGYSWASKVRIGYIIIESIMQSDKLFIYTHTPNIFAKCSSVVDSLRLFERRRRTHETSDQQTRRPPKTACNQDEDKEKRRPLNRMSSKEGISNDEDKQRPRPVKTTTSSESYQRDRRKQTWWSVLRKYFQ